jgi:hypothetical protein
MPTVWSDESGGRLLGKTAEEAVRPPLLVAVKIWTVEQSHICLLIKTNLDDIITVKLNVPM